MMIKQDNLVIREAKVADATILCKWWNDGRVMEHAGFPNGLNTSEREIESQIEKQSERNRRLILECTDQPIGEMSYRTVNDNTAEIGIKICDFNMQEKGLGKQYLRMLINYLFNTMDYNKIILDTNLNNLRAQHVYESIGFKKVRVNSDAWKNQLGVLQSSVDYELTKDFFRH